MTASTLTQLPLLAGGALLGTIGRAGSWLFARYMRAPFAATGLLAMVTMTALAGSNALYFQTETHPSPFFMPEHSVVASNVVPEPVRQTEAAPSRVISPLPAPARAETTGSVSSVQPALPDAPVGNSRMFALQKKLSELGLFAGKIDGYYGPQTANAIRAFELRNNLPLTGSHDSPVIERILSSDPAGRVTLPDQATLAQPRAVSAPAPTPLVPPTPARVQQVAATPQAIQMIQPVRSASAASPAVQAFDEVAIATANTIDGIIAAMEGVRTPPEKMASPPVPRATLPPIAPAQPMPAPVQLISATSASTASAASVAPATDGELVAQIQRGLASLGFFRAAIDGKPGPETARAIREFENFHRYKVTGLVKPDLVGLLRAEGASI